MLYSCNLFQPQIKHVAFTFSLQYSLWVIHKAVGTCLHVLWESFPNPCFCDGAGKLGVDAVCFQVKTSISFLGQAGVKGCCEVSHLSCHLLWCVPGRWQEGDKSCHPLLGLSARGLHQAVSQGTVSSATSGAWAASLPKVVVRVFVRCSSA